MSIRLKVFLSYVLIFFLILGNVSLIFLSGRRLDRVEQDVRTLHEARGYWSTLQVSLNEMMINWNDGKTYLAFQDNETALDEVIKRMEENRTRSGFLSAPLDPNGRAQALSAVWLIASDRLDDIHRAVVSGSFIAMTHRIQREPGLQRMSRLWSDYISSPAPPSPDETRGILAVREVMDHIEYFPLYSDTINRLLDVMIAESLDYSAGIKRVQVRLNLLILLLFLASYFLFARFFSQYLSDPIIAVSRDLSGFIGRELEVPHVGTGDEIRLLESSVDYLKAHYTALSEQAGQLAQGNLRAEFPPSPHQGIVGRSLNELAGYLKELATTSDWIRSGQFGAEVRPKSSDDVLANNFNVMSRVIEDRITTLRSMFEIVEEGILVVDDTGAVVESNARFSRLYNSGLDSTTLPDRDEELFTGYQSGIASLRSGGLAFKDRYTELKTRKGHRIPVRVTARCLPRVEDRPMKMMYSFVNESWRSRLRREKKKLLNHAMEAELRALRAQINPHFLFNTLNTIADLIESDAKGALTTVEELSGLFRYTLASTRRELVRLDEEMAFIRTYLGIEKKRFCDRLECFFDIEEGCLGLQIAPMLIQPIVENAVKHGHDSEGRVSMTIRIEKTGSSLSISVEDGGSTMVDLDTLLLRSGTGLRNVNQRLTTLYNQSLRFVRREPNGLDVSMTIPLEA